MRVEAADDDPADDPFGAQRERTEDPMRRLFREYGRDHGGSFAVGAVASVASRVLDLLPALFLGLAIDAVFRDDRAFGLPLVADAALPSTRQGQFWLVVALIATSFAGAAAFHWLRNRGWNAFAQAVQHDVRRDTYDAMQRLHVGFFADKQTGELMSVLSNDVNRLERFLNDGINSASRLLVMVLGIAAILLSINWQLALIALLPVPLIAVFTGRFVKAIQPKYAAVRSAVGALNARLENNLGGIQLIKAATTEPYESDRVDEASADYLDANWDAIETRIRFYPGLRLLAGFGFVTTFVVGGLWVLGGAPGPLSGTLSVGEFVVFVLYTQRFVWPIAQFGQIINMYQRAHASAERIFGLMDEPDAVGERSGARELAVDDGAVAFDDVTFGYDDHASDPDATTVDAETGPDGERDGDATGDRDPVIEEVSFDVAGGDTLALVGPTGAGKSTLVKLLLRFYDVDDGAIRIDGTDVRDVTIPSLRRAIGYVAQDGFLFPGTVRENIAYGSFDATDEEVRAAARAAEAHGFVENLPQGYDTEIGERGVKLSGGQRQRLTIARAVLRDPPILVLDEATSDVDTETETLIQRSLDRLTVDRTTIAIAHRLSTVKDADTIVVIDEGRVVERGTHDELLERDGLYANLWAVQAGEIDDLPERFVERASERRARVEDLDADGEHAESDD